MTYSQIVNEARRLVGANAVSYTIEDVTASANNALERIVSLIRQAEGRWQWDDTNYSSLPFATTDIVSGTGDYTLDLSHYDIIKVEVKNEAGNWTSLVPFDERDPVCASYSTLISSPGFPIIYDKVGTSLVIAPKPNFARTAALKVSYERGPSYFEEDDTTKQPGFNPLFHKLIPLWCAYDYAIINQLPIAIQLGTPDKNGNTVGMIPALESALIKFYSKRDKDDPIGLRSKTAKRSFK